MRATYRTLAECLEGAELGPVVVVVDVLRAFTTAAHALAAGADAIVCVDTVEAALAERDARPGALAIGEVDGRPPAEFDFGNSPSALASIDVAGRVLVQRTSAGTQGLVAAAAAPVVFAASFACAEATVQALAEVRGDVTFVLTGVDTRDGDEDRACADYLAERLAGHTPDPQPFLARVRAADAAQSFTTGDPDLPAADVDMATCLDAVAFALRARREAGRMVLRRAP